MAFERNNEQRGRILEVAYDLFLEKEYDAVTMKEIAARCGISLSLLQHYYAKKEYVLVQVLYNIVDAVQLFMERNLMNDIEKEPVNITGLYMCTEFKLFYDVLTRDRNKLLKVFTKVLFNAPLLTVGTVFAIKNTRSEGAVLNTAIERQGLYLLNGILSQLVSQYFLYHHPSIEESLNTGLLHYLHFIGLNDSESNDLIKRTDTLVTQQIKDKCYAEYQYEGFFRGASQLSYYDMETPF